MNYVTNFIWIIISCVVFNSQSQIDVKISKAVKKSNSIVLPSLLKTQVLTNEECKDLLTVAQAVKEQRERKLMQRFPHLIKNIKLFATTFMFLFAGGMTLETWKEGEIDEKYKTVITIFGGMTSVSALYAMKLLYNKYVSISRRKKYLSAIEIVQMLNRQSSH